MRSLIRRRSDNIQGISCWLDELFTNQRRASLKYSNGFSFIAHIEAAAADVVVIEANNH
jgi:hypothetical protein